MSTLTVTVLLQITDDPKSATVPAPPGWEVQLTNVPPKPTQLTDRSGSVRFEVEDGINYDFEVKDKAGTMTGKSKATGASHDTEAFVRWVPAANKRLLPLRTFFTTGAPGSRITELTDTSFTLSAPRKTALDCKSDQGGYLLAVVDESVGDVEAEYKPAAGDTSTLIPSGAISRARLTRDDSKGQYEYIDVLFHERPLIRVLPTDLDTGEVIEGLPFTLLPEPSDGNQEISGEVAWGPAEKQPLLAVPAGAYRFVPKLPFLVKGRPIRRAGPDGLHRIGHGGTNDPVRPTFEVLNADLIVTVKLVGGSAGIEVTFNGPHSEHRERTDSSGEVPPQCGRAGEVWSVEVGSKKVGGVRYVAENSRQSVTLRHGDNPLHFDLRPDTKHEVYGEVVDEDGQPAAGMIVEVYDSKKSLLNTGKTDQQGKYRIALPRAGQVYVIPSSEDGRLDEAAVVDVQSSVRAQTLVVRRGGGPPAGRTRDRDDGVLNQLAEFPLMTEDVSARGGGSGSGGAAPPGRDEGEAVEQVLRDVLGWRPRAGDATAFEAALTSAFDLAEVAGHTEATWRPRGYAVQADLGAVTGAQASLYARARSALDQILPLLDGLKPLRPAFDPEDTEAIRAVVRTELNEIVDELGVQGGPRVPRVDELFRQLTGSPTPASDPAAIGGQLKLLADRFGLKAERVNTLDEERVLSNFQIVVEQVLALDTGWKLSRNRLSGAGASGFFGNALINLSRSLDVVAESTDNLVFALDSVFVGPAERQVLQLDLAGGRLTLAELIEWVRRAVTVEGRRLIQDAGKDGVKAFAPVLRQLRDLCVEAADNASDCSNPPGYRTPRVRSALRELARQVELAASIADGVRR